MDQPVKTFDFTKLARGAATPEAYPAVDLAPPPGPLPTLTIPQRFAYDPAALKSRRVVLPEDRTPEAHAFRMLRTQVRRWLSTNQKCAIGVVSAIDGEGKTLTCANLALALSADPEVSVVLLELDLHRPSLSRLFGFSPERGLDDYVRGSAALDEIGCAFEGNDRLLVLPAIRPLSSPSVALRSVRVQEMLANLRAGPECQVVLVDLPPVLLSDDVLSIAPLLDGVVVVGREGVTRREDLLRLRQLLQGIPLVGSVLNAASAAETRAY